MQGIMTIMINVLGTTMIVIRTIVTMLNYC